MNPPPQGKIKKYGKIKRFGIKSNCIKDGGKIEIVITKNISRFGRDWKTVLFADMKIIYDSMNAKGSGENDAWAQIKKIGKAGFSGDAPAAYEKVEAVCKSVGLFVVPVGEMECFDKTVNKEKKDWVYYVLENYNLAVESKLEDARNFVQSVVNYKSSTKVGLK